MSSKYIYNPTPPRVWSRVENQCVYNTQDLNYSNLVYSALTQSYIHTKPRMNNNLF